MKGSVVAAHEMAAKSKGKAAAKKESEGCYCKEASSRFPHLTDGSNRGFKMEGGAPMSANYDELFKNIGEGAKAIGEAGKNMPQEEKRWFKQVV